MSRSLYGDQEAGAGVEQDGQMRSFPLSGLFDILSSSACTMLPDVLYTVSVARMSVQCRVR